VWSADRPGRHRGHRVRRRPCRSGTGLRRHRPWCPGLRRCRRGDLIRFAAATVAGGVVLRRLLRWRDDRLGGRGSVLTRRRHRDVHARCRHGDVDSPRLHVHRDRRDADAHLNRDRRDRRYYRRLGSVLRSGCRDVHHERQETDGRQRGEAARRSRISRVTTRRRAGTSDPLSAAATSSRHGQNFAPVACIERCRDRTRSQCDSEKPTRRPVLPTL